MKWAEGCYVDHGQPPLGDDPPHEDIGQNLYVVGGTSAINVKVAVQEWYDEKSDYNYDTLECAEGKMCGHYTQVVPR